MTPTAQIAAIRQRAEQATPGPWRTREEATPSGQLTVMGGERGRLYVAMAVKSSLQPGVTGRMSVTFGVLVQRVMTP